MAENLNTAKLINNNLESISGGSSVKVFVDEPCCKPKGSFKLLEGKESEWKMANCPEQCKYCWNLKFKDRFFCDV